MRKRVVATMMLFCVAFILLLSACSKQYSDVDILCEDSQYSNYSDVLRANVSSYVVGVSDKNLALYGLEGGAAIEAFDSFALPMIAAGQAKYWYPQYLSTVVIAIDRNQTNVVITNWTDLTESGLQVGINDRPLDFGLIFAAISHSIEGEGFSLNAAVQVLAPVHKLGNLKINNLDTPVLVCFDNQAATMMKDGRNLEIIIPAAGTLTFKKGLLSDTPLVLPDIHDALVAGGMRLLDGTCDDCIYPPAAEYERAILLNDYTHVNKVAQNTTKVYRRDISGIRLYATADAQEHQTAALIYIATVVIWIGSIAHRAMQKSVRRAAIITGVLLVGWVLTRMLKHQLIEAGPLSRHLWFGYYIFELGIPLVLLWLASTINKPKEKIRVPKWWVYFALISVTLALLVMSNDLHQLVFKMDLSGNNWSRNYSYGPGYYAVLIVISIEIVLSQIMMVKKSRHSSKKLAFLFPLSVYMLFIGYCIGYILRVPILFENDLMITLGVFTLLIIEVCVRIDIIPVNHNYRKFFSYSPQKMQIIDDSGNTLLQASRAEFMTKEVWAELNANSYIPQPVGEDALLYAGHINGGMVVWQEDMRTLNVLTRDLNTSLEQLRIANTVLERAVMVDRHRETPIARAVLLSNLEKKIRSDFENLADMVRNVSEEENRRRHLAQMSMLICHIKRKCHFFFLEQKVQEITAYELSAYTDELVEFASFSGIQCDCRFRAAGNIPIRAATLIYDFFYRSFIWIHEHGGKALMLKLETDEAAIVGSILYDNSIPRILLDEYFLQEIFSAGGVSSDSMPAFLDSMSLALRFPHGGDSHA